ncbi:hypothetical protein Pint_03174 [Pistacia integerrima]|uniref:Uncharacterized protein n=1 Tax=Pistacia integerrima TaxID=434235 RepID=A0ACC0ZHE6_9ROSI|nr:hypothetical protein Pint_03174 [Pistacia integerrima]
MMAMQADSSALSPEVVGNAFVEQYYSILCPSPDNGINDKILSMDYQNFKVQIFSADAQASYNKGLIVLVTGCLLAKDNLRRKFTQSFFLAPQDKGYFVLNDFFRYVDENHEMEDEEESKGVVNNKADESAPTAPLAADPGRFLCPKLHFNFSPIHAPHNHAVNHNSSTPANEATENGKEVSHPLDNGKVLVAEKVVVPEHPIVSSQNAAPPVTKTLASKTQDEVPKKSFASVVQDLKKSNSPSNVVLRVPPVKLVEQSRVIAAAAIETAPNSNSSVDKNNNNAAVKGHSIFVGNLLDTATVGQLKVVFEQFGPIKPDGIQVRSQKQTGNCFGFVEFESTSSVQSVLKASPISIGNRRASIENRMMEARIVSRTVKSHGVRVARTHMHDWLILLLLVVIIAILLLMQPFYRFVGKDMMIDLRYPLKRVLTWVVMTVVYAKFFDRSALQLINYATFTVPSLQLSEIVLYSRVMFVGCFVGEYPGVKDSWMDVFASQGSSSLLSVDLCGSDVTDTGLDLLKDCTNIQALTFNNCDKISEPGLKHISGDPFYFFLLHAASLL